MTRPFHPANFYGKRLLTVIEYIDKNLAEPLPLSVLSERAEFSQSYFKKIFIEWMGETPQAYLRRCRLDRAATLLRDGTDTLVKEIAPQCGYKSPEAFNRAFFGYFGMTPLEWRAGGYMRWYKPSASAMPDSTGLAYSQVKVKKVEPFQIIYKRKIGPYAKGEAALWNKFSEMVDPLNIRVQDCYGLGLDDPTLTPPDQCRFDVCLKLPPLLTVLSHTPVRLVPGGYYATLPYQGPAGKTREHWSWLFNVWLPKSGFKIGKNASFERYPFGIPKIGTTVQSELHLPLIR